MDEVLKEPVQLSKGINLKELLTSQTEFHIDLDFKQKQHMEPQLDRNDELFQALDDDDDDSDCDDILKNIEESTEKMLLSSPEYQSFKELATKMTDCVASGDAKILIIEEGDGPLIPVDAEVTLHYAAYWEREKIPFDSTLTMNFGAPLKIRLGRGKILPGLEIGLTTLRGPTARAQLILQPVLTWGPQGAPPRIRPEPALFILSVYAVRDVIAQHIFNDLPMEEQKKFEVTMRTVTSLHSEAKELFAKKKYQRAIKNYQQAMSVLSLSRPENETEEQEIKQLRINTYVSLAMCYYKINKPKYVISMLENLDYVTNIDNHCKALFYYGKAYQMLGNIEEALRYYRKALKLEPKNKDIGKTLSELDEYLKKSAMKEKKMWQNAFKIEPSTTKESVVYDVDEDFQNGVRDMCQNLAGRKDYARFDLPTGLTKDEMACIKSMITDFEGLCLLEDGEGKRKKVSIVKKML